MHKVGVRIFVGVSACGRVGTCVSMRGVEQFHHNAGKQPFARMHTDLSKVDAFAHTHAPACTHNTRGLR